MEVDGGGLCSSLRQFLLEFSDRTSPTSEEGVQLRTVIAENNYLQPQDIYCEVLDWALSYLEQRKCPYTVAVVLAKQVAEAMSSAAAEQVASTNGTSDVETEKPLYESLHLHSQVINHLHDLCDHWWDQPDLVPPSSILSRNVPYTVSICAIKNGRRKMEDRHVILHDLNAICNLPEYPQHSYYAVFDGHAGVDAASYAAAHLHMNIVQHPSFLSHTEIAIKDAFKTTDAHFLERSSRDNIKSGCTAVCCLVRERTIYLAWLGDSQAILVRQGMPIDIMSPHKPDRHDEKQRIEGLGGYVLYVGTWRVNGTLAVSRALGDPEYKPYVSSEADVVEIGLDGTEDFLVLACDGLWDKLDANNVTAMVYQYVVDNPSDPEGVANHLVQYAKDQGSSDNITTIVVFLKDIPSIAATAKSMLSSFPRQLTSDAEKINGVPQRNGGQNPYVNDSTQLLNLYQSVGKDGFSPNPLIGEPRRQLHPDDPGFPDSCGFAVGDPIGANGPEEIFCPTNDNTAVETTEISELPTPTIDEVMAARQLHTNPFGDFESGEFVKSDHQFNLISDRGDITHIEDKVSPGIVHDQDAQEVAAEIVTSAIESAVDVVLSPTDREHKADKLPSDSHFDDLSDNELPDPIENMRLGMGLGSAIPMSPCEQVDEAFVDYHDLGDMQMEEPLLGTPSPAETTETDSGAFVPDVNEQVMEWMQTEVASVTDVHEEVLDETSLQGGGDVQSPLKYEGSLPLGSFTMGEPRSHYEASTKSDFVGEPQNVPLNVDHESLFVSVDQPDIAQNFSEVPVPEIPVFRSPLEPTHVWLEASAVADKQMTFGESLFQPVSLTNTVDVTTDTSSPVPLASPTMPDVSVEAQPPATAPFLCGSSDLSEDIPNLEKLNLHAKENLAGAELGYSIGMEELNPPSAHPHLSSELDAYGLMPFEEAQQIRSSSPVECTKAETETTYILPTPEETVKLLEEELPLETTLGSTGLAELDAPEMANFSDISEFDNVPIKANFSDTSDLGKLPQEADLNVPSEKLPDAYSVPEEPTKTESPIIEKQLDLVQLSQQETVEKESMHVKVEKAPDEQHSIPDVLPLFEPPEFQMPPPMTAQPPVEQPVSEPPVPSLGESLPSPIAAEMPVMHNTNFSEPAAGIPEMLSLQMPSAEMVMPATPDHEDIVQSLEEVSPTDALQRETSPLILPELAVETKLEVTEVTPTADDVGKENQPSVDHVVLDAIPDGVPEAEGVTEDVDSDSEKDGGWSYIKGERGQELTAESKSSPVTTPVVEAPMQPSTKKSGRPSAGMVKKDPVKTRIDAKDKPKQTGEAEKAKKAALAKTDKAVDDKIKPKVDSKTLAPRQPIQKKTPAAGTATMVAAPKKPLVSRISGSKPAKAAATALAPPKPATSASAPPKPVATAPAPSKPAPTSASTLRPAAPKLAPKLSGTLGSASRSAPQTSKPPEKKPATLQPTSRPKLSPTLQKSNVSATAPKPSGTSATSRPSSATLGATSTQKPRPKPLATKAPVDKRPSSAATKQPQGLGSTLSQTEKLKTTSRLTATAHAKLSPTLKPDPKEAKNTANKQISSSSQSTLQKPKTPAARLTPTGKTSLKNGTLSTRPTPTAKGTMKKPISLKQTEEAALPKDEAVTETAVPMKNGIGEEATLDQEKGSMEQHTKEVTGEGQSVVPEVKEVNGCLQPEAMPINYLSSEL